MSFANLVKNYEAKGKIKLNPGQCTGKVEVKDERLSASKYAPPVGKGAEYVCSLKTKEKEYMEMKNASKNQGIRRVDVTNGETNERETANELTSVGTALSVRDLDREELTQVYSRYQFDPVEPNEQLENIHSKKEEIMSIINCNTVCIIKGHTGCGKSTQIPQFILDSHVKQQKYCNIVVTQPRRMAAISIARRVCEERGWDVGGIVGYQVGLDKKADVDTRLLYCTTGVLLEKLIAKKNLNDYTHIILDEVHEREEDMDILMLVVKRFLMTASQDVKVVLMSATIDVGKFANYFKCYALDRTFPAPFYTIEAERKFTIQVNYLDSIENIIGNLANIKFDEPTISEEAYKFVPLLIRGFNNIDMEDYKSRRSNEKKGAVLIFLPGLHQIETLYEILSKEDQMQRKIDPENALNLMLCPLHSSITKDEQEKVVQYAPEDTRKVILSTNIAESSLTIPDVKYVIDFCLTKHLVADPTTGLTSLQMSWASHVNCKQREGRVGRVQDGRVYRMVPKNFYQFKLPVTPKPEICRCPLELVVLKCKRLMEDECPLKIISDAIDPPDLDSYEKTILKLKEIGALLLTTRGVEDLEDGDLTFLGHVMGSLPVDIRITKLILLGHLFDVLEEAIIMGCAMSVRNIFSEPFQKRLHAYNNKLLWADVSESDSIAYLNAYQVWRKNTAMGKFQRSKGTEAGWCKTYMLQIKQLKEVSLLEEEIKKRLKNFNIKTERFKNKPLWNKEEKPLILKLVLAGAFYPNFYTCNIQNLNAEMDAVRILNSHNPYQCVYLQNMVQPAILYIDQIKEIFRENQISDNIMVDYDTSQKLIVEFNQTSMSTQDIGERELHADIPGEIVMPVYRAIKLRQLNVPLAIRTFSSSEAKERLLALESSRRSKLSSRLQSSEYKPLIPWDQQIVEMTVSHVENAGSFYGHICPETQEKLKDVFMLLNNSDLLCACDEVDDNVIYAAPFRDEGETEPKYYRAKIIRKHSQHFNHRPMVDVFFIDYGNSIKAMPESDLRGIVCVDAQRELLDSIPPLAVKCVLAEVAPNVLHTAKGGFWSDEANSFVKGILSSGRNSWTTKIYSFVNGVASVYLFLEEVGGNGKSLLTLNNLLIDKGFATPKEESYLSKRNHVKREEIARGVSTLNSIEDKNVFKTKDQDLLTLPIAEGKSAIYHVKGPYSPLEMKLYSKTKSSCQKEVRVEWNSVNSVLLETDPNQPYEKLLVAGHVGQSADKSRLTLNHTTVLPNIKGLAALICLIFAPTIELRTDKFRSRYIGALCGLGSDAVTGRPFFQENDMEIKFDVEIKDEDLLLVNKLRYWLNQAFSSKDDEHMMDDQIIQMQQNIRSLLLKLISTYRQPIKVEHFQNAHRWRFVNQEDLVPPFKEDEHLFLNKIYQLISAIDLDSSRDKKYIEELVKKVKNLMNCAQKNLAPKELVCHLCDVDYPYWKQLHDHTFSGHHQQLFKWLRGRAIEHGLQLDVQPPSELRPVNSPSMELRLSN